MVNGQCYGDKEKKNYFGIILTGGFFVMELSIISKQLSESSSTLEVCFIKSFVAACVVSGEDRVRNISFGNMTQS